MFSFRIPKNILYIISSKSQPSRMHNTITVPRGENNGSAVFSWQFHWIHLDSYLIKFKKDKCFRWHIRSSSDNPRWQTAIKMSSAKLMNKQDLDLMKEEDVSFHTWPVTRSSLPIFAVTSSPSLIQPFFDFPPLPKLLSNRRSKVDEADSVAQGV